MHGNTSASFAASSLADGLSGEALKALAGDRAVVVIGNVTVTYGVPASAPPGAPPPEPEPPPQPEPNLDLKLTTFVKMLLYQYKSYYETGHTPPDMEAAKKFRETQIWEEDERSQANAYNKWLNNKLPKDLRPPRDTARGGDRRHG